MSSNTMTGVVTKFKPKEINTKELKETWLRALLYGASGTGKTCTILTLPTERCLAILVEPKHLPLRDHDVDAWLADTWEDVKGIFRIIRDSLSNGGLIINGRKKDIIVIDSLSAISDLCKAQITAKDRPALLKRRQKKDVGGIYDEVLAQDDWGLYGIRINNLVSAYCHLPCHIIFTCLEKWTEDKKARELLITPALNGAAATGIAHHFDEVYRIENIGTAYAEEYFNSKDPHPRAFRTQRTAQILAKGSEKLAELEPNNWFKVISKIFATPKANKKQKKEAVA